MTSISILMPVYNSSKTIKNAINSVLNQTFSDWELLCVDDGSADNSLKILQEYIHIDERIKCFTQENQGPLAARRLAFENSTGQYIIYLDSDDSYSADTLESLYSRALATNADAIAPDMIYANEQQSISWNTMNQIDIKEELNGLQGFAETFPWRKLHNFNLWKREIFEKSTYHPYLENNNFNADEILQRILLLNCQKIVFAESGKYIHNYNSESITKVLQKRSFNRLDANEKLIQLGRDYKVSAEIMEKIYGFSFFCQLKGLMLDYYSQQNKLSDKDRKWAMDKMKKAFYHYKKHTMNNIYGDSILSNIKKMIQTRYFSIFRLLCFIQSKMQ